MASSAAAQGHIFIGPGLSPFKRTVTVLGVLGITALVLWIKEEFFPNGKRIGVIAYRRPATPEQKAKAWAVYRDDITDIDGLAAALKEAIPETCQWVSETVHE